MKHWMRKLAALLAAVVLSGTLVACNTANSKVDSPYIGENGNWWVGTTDSGIKAAGEPGSDGAQGEKGDKGDTGAQGEKGEKGDKGDTGAQGEKGDKGDKGDTGAQGEKGDKGDTGAQGEKGDKGDTGAQGEKGEKGDTGAQGEKGEKGEKGDTGVQGEKGDKGDTGAQGEKGEKGDKGDTGAQGEKGDKGDKGDTGAQGEKGDKGDTGAQGEKGDKGDTGAQGEKGEKGDTGAQGEKGEKGEKGDTGAQGEKGDTGDTGAQGEKGDKGDTGAQGEKGDKGDTGAQGEKGDTGATGRVGFVVDSAVALLTAARVPNSYIILMNDITLEDGVIEATARDLSFILDLNGCKLSGSLAFRAATGRSMEAIITNGTLSAAITATGKVSLITDEGRVTAIVGTERYTDLARALTKAPDGATVYLLRDVTSGGSLSVPTRKKLVLDLGGHTYNITSPVSVWDEGNAYSCGLLIPASGRLTVRNGSIEAANAHILVRTQGNFTAENVTLSGGKSATLRVVGGQTSLAADTVLTAPDGALAVDLYGSNTTVGVTFETTFSGRVIGGLRIARKTGTTGAMRFRIYGNGQFSHRVSNEIPDGQVGCDVDLAGWNRTTSFDQLRGQASKVILLIGDGMGDNHIRNTQLNYDRAMYVDELEYKGHISTFSNHTVCTDSAAAASALATGRKYNNYEVTHHDGVDIASITEQAKAAGYGVAVVTTDVLSGATPACFSAHAPERTLTDVIISSQIAGSADLLMGRGSQQYTNAQARFEAVGFRFFSAMDQLDMNASRLIAAFPSTSSENGTDTAPTLSMMTEFAVRYMEQHFPNGYILIAEGAYMDKRSHENNLAGMMRHMRNFDITVESVCRTLSDQQGVAVLVTADHECGGLKLAKNKSELDRSLYTSKHHTAVDVPYFIRLQIASGVPADYFTERMDNTDIYRIMRSLLGV